jgi:hypothetical protein
MRFTTTRLCGGEALMAVSSEELDLDLTRAAEIFEKEGFEIKEKDDMMLIVIWNGMETTVYPQGKIMFFPLKDKKLCIDHATMLISMMR